jgi:hypothetical protein
MVIESKVYTRIAESLKSLEIELESTIYSARMAESDEDLLNFSRGIQFVRESIVEKKAILSILDEFAKEACIEIKLVEN